MDGKSVASLRTAHLGKILFNFSILGAVLCVASFLSFILIAFYYIILIVTLLGTVFLILIYMPEFAELFADGQKMMDFIVIFSNNWVPVIAPVTAVIAAMSIVLLAISKQRNVTVRIVFASIFLVVGVVFTFLRYVVGGIGQ